MITRSFKSVRGVLKFLSNALVCNYSISTMFKLKWFALSSHSPRTSLTPISLKESSMSNLRLWGGGGGSNVISGGRFCNLHEFLIYWYSTIVNLTLHTLRSAKTWTDHKAITTKFPKVSTITRDIRYAFPKKAERQFLGFLEEVLRHKRRNHPPPSYTFNKDYLPSPSKVNQE